MEKFLGIPIHFYAQIDFSAFEQFIDELGGVEVDVPEEISVDPIGPHNTVVLKPGLQTLDGPTALAYARNRDTIGNDFDRAQRQQQVIMAIRNQILNLKMLPQLIKKSPVLYKQLSSGVHTNLSLQQLISLAWLAQQVPSESIKRSAIGTDQVIMDFSPEGLSILRPIPEEVRRLRDEVFTATGPPSPIVEETPQGDPAELVKAENAQVAVLNGTQIPRLAAETSDYLISQGINVTQVDNAQETYAYTTIIDYSGELYTVQFLVDLMGIQPDQIYSRYYPNSPVDIAILLGNDWALSCPAYEFNPHDDRLYNLYYRKTVLIDNYIFLMIIADNRTWLYFPSGPIRKLSSFFRPENIQLMAYYRLPSFYDNKPSVNFRKR